MTWANVCVDCGRIKPRRQYAPSPWCRRHLLMRHGWQQTRWYNAAGNRLWINGERRCVFEHAWKMLRDAKESRDWRCDQPHYDVLGDRHVVCAALSGHDGWHTMRQGAVTYSWAC